MTKDEALKLALETLEYAGPSWIDARQPAITAIKEALAQPEQETLAWEQFYPDMGKPQLAPPHPWEKFCDSNCVWTDHHPDCKLAQPEQEPFMASYEFKQYGYYKDGKGTLKLGNIPATQPPQRTWVGLTEDEAFACQGRDYFETYKAIEAKLKEKNSG